MDDAWDKVIRDYAVLTPQVVHPGIIRPEVKAANFELKPVMFQMLQIVASSMDCQMNILISILSYSWK